LIRAMLAEADFAYIAREMKARAGLVLGANAQAATEARLAPLARREGFASAAEFVTAARLRRDEKLWSAIADALLPAETRFFHSRALFAALKSDILPGLFAKKSGRLKIWCAGVSTGQEAYSLAMLIEELRAEGAPGADILATDMSERLLDKARSGLYTQFEIQRGLPIRKLIEHFEKVSDLWRISDRMRAGVRFAQHNLLQETGGYGPFDLVLCCNVLCGMEAGTRKGVAERIAAACTPDAVLALGETERAPEETDAFVSAAGGSYVLTRNAGWRAAA
jgi:chemotaxis protein methyltransferase CheR